MYTSGSTGQPKGVCIPHRGVVRLVKGTEYSKLDSEQVFLQLAPLAFDASTFEIWGSLLHGARLIIFAPHTPTPNEIEEFARRHNITTLWLTAGLFQQVIDLCPEYWSLYNNFSLAAMYYRCRMFKRPRGCSTDALSSTATAQPRTPRSPAVTG
jgi:acyl-coenzyme A synthetase/AMP-(fatty) acid ligase